MPTIDKRDVQLVKYTCKKLYKDPNLSHQVIYFHFCPPNDDHRGCEQTASCDGASAPPQRSLVADNLLPAKHRPEMGQN